MKNIILKEDVNSLRNAFLKSVNDFCINGKTNYLLYSGGIDSTCALFALTELGLPYKIINFKIKNVESIDTQSVITMQRKMGFGLQIIEVDPYDKDCLNEALRLCKEIYGRIRRVKVETIFPMLQIRNCVPDDVNILSASWGDNALGYHRKDAILISKVGEDAPEVIRMRRGDKNKDEIRRVFYKWSYVDPFQEKTFLDEVCKYTCKALNKKFPKSAYIYMFDEYFRKYKAMRKPIGYHKASKTVDVFENIARERGYSSALQMFNRIGKENER